MLAIEKIAEKRIKEALEKGELDDIPGCGEPLPMEDDSGVPEDLRLAYKILKNADCIPPELALKKDIKKMEDMLENIPDEREKYKQIKRVNFKILQLNMIKKTSPLMEESERYYPKILEKMGKKKHPPSRSGNGREGSSP